MILYGLSFPGDNDHTRRVIQIVFSLFVRIQQHTAAIDESMPAKNK